MLDWLDSLSQPAAAFVGTLIGSTLGLLALLAGALFNARLNRQRDNRLRNEERLSLASALIAELSTIVGSLKRNAEMLDESQGGFYGRDLSLQVRMFPSLVSKLWLLAPETIEEVIKAYSLIDQYTEDMVILGGQLQGGMPSNRRVFKMPPGHEPTIAKKNRFLVKRLEGVIATLKAELGDDVRPRTVTQNEQEQ